MLAAVPAPRRRGAALAREETEALVADDVDPRHRRAKRRRSVVRADHVLAAVGAEAAVAVVAAKRGLGSRGLALCFHEAAIARAGFLSFRGNLIHRGGERARLE